MGDSDIRSAVGPKHEQYWDTFRHCHGTHLLEIGVNLRLIQANLGHNSPKTTALYTHLTEPAQATLRDPLNTLMRDL
jgi:site-specific recombinase XerD